MTAEFARRPSLALLHSNARLIDDAGSELPVTLFGALEVTDKTLSEIHAGRAFGVLLRRNFVTGATVLVRRSFLAAAVPFAHGWVHDEWLAIAASVLGELDVLEDTLIGYRQHDTNQIGAAKLSLLGKFHRMIEPGAVRNERLLDRAIALVERLEAMGDAVLPRHLAAAQAKVRHERVRASLPPLRLARVIPVVRELSTGRYSTFGRGVLDAIRDLFQPL
jgi:hypothetical protein